MANIQRTRVVREQVKSSDTGRLRRTQVTDANLQAFRTTYNILEPVFTFIFDPRFHRIDLGSVELMPFHTKAIVEEGLKFPLPTLLLRVLMKLRLFPLQCCISLFRIVMGIVALNAWLWMNLGVDEILFCYDLK